MKHAHGRSGRHFTEAARARGLEVRRAKASEPKRHAEVFITRDTSAGRLFAWEIRRFGGLVLDRGVAGFADAADARRAGEAVLAVKGTFIDQSAQEGSGRFAQEDEQRPSFSPSRVQASVRPSATDRSLRTIKA